MIVKANSSFFHTAGTDTPSPVLPSPLYQLLHGYGAGYFFRGIVSDNDGVITDAGILPVIGFFWYMVRLSMIEKLTTTALIFSMSLLGPAG